MFTLLSKICYSLTGGHLDEDVFDKYIFYHILACKTDSGKRKIFTSMKIRSKMTNHQLKIFGFPYYVSEKKIYNILRGNKFSNFFFKYGTPSFIWMNKGLQTPVLYFSDKDKLENAKNRINEYGTNPKSGYEIVAMDISEYSICQKCSKFLEYYSEKNMGKMKMNHKPLCIQCMKRH